VQPRPGREIGDDLLPTYQLRYAWFFGAALGLLALATVISDRPRTKLHTENGEAKAVEQPDSSQGRRAWWLTPAVLLLTAAVPALDAEQFLRAGNAAFERE